MKFSIDQQIFEQFPDLKVGAILIKGFNNGKRVSAVESLLRGICAQRGREFKSQEIDENPMIQPWYQAYGNFGINPKKYPPSIAALLKRVRRGDEIPHINLLVDIYNYFSLKYLLPIGGEDIDWLAGDLHLTYTKGGEAFRPLGSIDVEDAKEGEVAYMDKGGITCRYWNHRECERTKFTEKTMNAVIFVEDISKMHMDRFGEIVDEIASAMSRYVGGSVETYVLTEDGSTIDLGVEGRRIADDSKISQQERAFFEMEKAKKKVSRPKLLKKENPQMKIKLATNRDKFIDDEGTLRRELKDLMDITVVKAFPQITSIDTHIEYPAQAEHGDYACNIALQLAKELQLAPRDVAQKIVDQISENAIISKVEIAGPGFINFFISSERLGAEIAQVLELKDKYGHSAAGRNKTVIVEYSSPNIAKPLGVHHLQTTIIGQALYNLLKAEGFNAISINHLGDWGTQFGKLIYAYKQWGNKKTVEKNPITELQKLYVQFHEEAEKEPELEDKGREEFRKFEQGDKENRKLWQWFVDVSLKEIQETYDKLGGIHFDHIQGESFYESMLEETLREGKEKNIFVKGEEGAFVVEYDDPNMAPLVVQKKDGATLYSTRDVATAKYRINHWHPAKILYVVDYAQTLYFKQLFAAYERFPWYHGECEHVWFGRMHMQDGKMSTRKGNMILLKEVLDESVERARAIIDEKSPDLKDKDAAAKALGIGAVKYNILSQNRSTDIIFDWDRMLSLEGNSAPYLQYTYARARSILRRASASDQNSESKAVTIADPADLEEKVRAVIRLFPKFIEQILLGVQEYKPNIIANYLYELAQAFNSFYNSVPVLKAEREREQRLQIVDAASQILKNGLELLGIEVVEEM